ncbi:hypothetical protein SAMN04488510_13110 [Fervidobacterium changbaicum]|uniref:Uncharacterized protein n=1 Tax=Fervidobacterium changbaicum TaxID=310769 RepID=A0AAE6CDT9_9BACT|nr:hypothetical protein CBS1_05465 [Fervidobacterium changbaicum]SDH75676.1 hypothetical protein SAMN04488510_13110 [Fervidobacterium changbaicum]
MNELNGFLISFFGLILNLFKKFFRFSRILGKQKSQTLTLAIIHYDGRDLQSVLKEFSLELNTADVIVARNFTQADLKTTKRLLKKDVVFLDKNGVLIFKHGNRANFISSFDVHKLRSFEKHGAKIVVSLDKKTAWMISQMFPFYCVVPGEPFQDTIITAPIPLTRSSDGFYFSKIAYRNQVTLIDLNVDILKDFKAG